MVFACLLTDYLRGLSSEPTPQWAVSRNNIAETVRCLVPRCDGVSYCHLPSKEILWDNYSTAAPERQRQFVAQYNIVKRV